MPARLLGGEIGIGAQDVLPVVARRLLDLRLVDLHLGVAEPDVALERGVAQERLGGGVLPHLPAQPCDDFLPARTIVLGLGGVMADDEGLAIIAHGLDPDLDLLNRLPVGSLVGDRVLHGQARPGADNVLDAVLPQFLQDLVADHAAIGADDHPADLKPRLQHTKHLTERLDVARVAREHLVTDRHALPRRQQADRDQPAIVALLLRLAELGQRADGGTREIGVRRVHQDEIDLRGEELLVAVPENLLELLLVRLEEIHGLVEVA